MKMQNLLDSLLQKAVQEGCFPGAVAACGDRTNVYALSCAGKIADGAAAVDLNTRYDMASLSKILGPTMIALKAIEQGDIAVGDELNRFWDGLPDDKREITIWHMMTHTTGLAASFRLDEVLTDPAGTFDKLMESPLENPPGTKVNYSCMGYITLGKTLEKYYGKPLDVLAKEMVFDPLGMKNTCYCPTGDNIAPTELDPATGRLIQGVVHDENARFLNGVSGNAGVFTDIGDMIRFAQMLARGGDGYLSPVVLQTAIRCQAESPDARRGLGFHLAGTHQNFMGELMPRDSFGHTGFTGTSLAVDPHTGFFVVLLANRVCPTRQNLRMFSFRRRLHNALYAEYMRK